MTGYIVKFIRADQKPSENYFYHNLEEAKKYFDMFHNDDSKLYKRVELIKLKADRSVIDFIVFSFPES